ncbi:MAG: class I SAM-dependent methyltransferase [Deltaproteobacteria bacterium]|nr:class I SAM-dependent methyltransferase [Deltaproteobacteria bacterium]
MGLEAIYTRAFFAEYGVASPTYAGCCARIAEELVRRFRPASAVDWGCGAGLHLATLQRLGVRAIGVEGTAVPADLCAPGVEVRFADLREPLPEGLVPGSYDLSLCLDVLEHLDAAHAEQALETITRGAGLLVLSCAPPGQGGTHHVNEQPRRYWIARLAELGWRYDRRETGALEGALRAQGAAIPLSWTYHNLCVYRPTGY